MPNYANTIMYQIICDGECYVGHTTNFERRKNSHKSDCINETCKRYNFKLYVFIREHGGWDSCEISIIENYPCENKIEAVMREEHWRVKKNAILNTLIPYKSKEQVKKERKIKDKNNRDKIRQVEMIWYEKNKHKKNKYRRQMYKQKKLKAQMLLELVDSAR